MTNSNTILRLSTISVLCFAVLVGPIGGVVGQTGPAPLPGAYYGSVTVDGETPPSGTTIEAEINGQVRGSIEVNDGRFGGPNATDEKLVVSGNSTENEQAIVQFYIVNENIGRLEADQTVTWESGAVESVTLSADSTVAEDTDVTSSSGGSGGGSGGGSSVQTEDQMPTEGENEPSITVSEPIRDTRPSESGTTVSFAESQVSSVTFAGDPTGSIEINDYGAQLPPNSPDIGEREVLGGVTVTPPDEAQTMPATVEFRVERDSVNPSDIVVLRGADAAYQALPTATEVHSNELIVRAETPGFSVFVITIENNNGNKSSETPSNVNNSSESQVSPETRDGSTVNETTNQTEGSTTDDRIIGFSSVITLVALVTTMTILRHRINS